MCNKISSVTSKQQFKPCSYSRLAAVEDNHWWFISRNKIILWCLENKTSNMSCFLEIGCGTGYVLNAISKRYPDSTIHGTDYYEEGLSFAKHRLPTASISQQDARLINIIKIYDVIGAFDVIEHIKEDELVLSNLFRALKKEGRIVLTVPQHKWLWSKVDDNACHVRRYSRSELVTKLNNNNFIVEYVSSFVFILLPMMWLFRRHLNNDDSDSSNELKHPKLLNHIFKKVMSIEFWLMKRGLTFPFGGSLLIVAKKKAMFALSVDLLYTDN
jgi:SAM-dependent methyltransferase